MIVKFIANVFKLKLKYSNIYNMIKSFKQFLIKESIRNKYELLGPKNYYLNHSNEYENPHSERIIKSLNYIKSRIEVGYFLDLSCGNGVVSEYLLNNGYNNFKGCDPYFSKIYKDKFKKECFNSSFEDISKNGLYEKFETIICSYALHLCPKSYMNNLLYNLSMSCMNFIVISPSKYPTIDEDFFQLQESKIIDRTHIRIYKSLI